MFKDIILLLNFLSRLFFLDWVLALGVPPTLVLFPAPPQTQYRVHLYINGTFIFTLYLILDHSIYSMSCKFMFEIQHFFICANPSIYLYGLKVMQGKYIHTFISTLLSWPSGLGADTSRRERSVPARGRFHLGRGGQSVNSMKLYNFSSWEPGKKHQSTCRVS